MKEHDISVQIRLEYSQRGARLFRNNVGNGWVGRTKTNQNGSMTIFDPRPLHAGLCVGSSDLIGWTSDGRFMAVEVKTPGVRVTKEQAGFIEAVKRSGGCAGIAFSVDEALSLLP